MTIICIKDNVMAADGYGTFATGYLATDNITKIILPSPGEVWSICGQRVIGFGITGATPVIEIACDLLRKGIYHDTKPYHQERDALILAVTETFEVFDVTIAPDVISVTHLGGTNNDKFKSNPEAVGLGALVARTYMFAGKSAKEAVKYLIKTNVMLGGTIQEVDFVAFKAELAAKEKELPAGFVFQPNFQHLTPKPIQHQTQQVAK